MTQPDASYRLWPRRFRGRGAVAHPYVLLLGFTTCSSSRWVGRIDRSAGAVHREESA